MVYTYKLKLTNLQQEILRLLSMRVGVPLNQRSIARATGVTATAVITAIPELEKQELINAKQDEESKRWSIELNRDNHKVMQLKRVDNLKLIYETGLADFLENEFAGATIILFGSYSRGEDTLKSDIDIAVIGRKDKLIELEKFEKVLERKINLNFYDSFKQIHKHLKNNILNGIILYGSVDL